MENQRLVRMFYWHLKFVGNVHITGGGKHSVAWVLQLAVKFGYCLFFFQLFGSSIFHYFFQRARDTLLFSGWRRGSVMNLMIVYLKQHTGRFSDATHANNAKRFRCFIVISE